MQKEDEIFFNQSIISRIGKITPSTLSRFLNKNPIGESSQIDNTRRKFNLEQTRAILTNVLGKKENIKNKIQVFFNFKGGTGKTSLCYQVSAFLALMGYKVLAVDCDPQAHLSYVLGFEEDQEYKTLYDILINKFSIFDAIHKDIYPGLDFIPSNLSLTRLELPLSQQPNREKSLLRVLEAVKNDYDFILIDTNPTISIVNQNATLASDILNIICETQPFSLKGLELLVSEISDFSDAMENNINYFIIPNKYESKTATSQEALGILRFDYEKAVLDSIVRRCEDINISAKKRMPLYGFCSKNSAALEDIVDLVHEIIEKS